MDDVSPATGSTSLPPDSGVVYWLDSSKRIVEVNRAFDDFAQENEASLRAADVVGKELFRYIVGDSSRMYVDVVLDHARIMKRPIVRPYRCDSPGVKRFMQMTVSLEPSGLVRLEHQCLSREAITPPVEFRYAEGRRSMKRCTFCNRIEQQGEWREPDVMRPQAKSGTAQFVIYGVCGDCRGGLDRFRRPSPTQSP